MTLIACRECGHEVSSEAENCPKCGVRIKPKSRTWLKVLGWLVGIPLVLFIIFAIKGANDPEIQAMQKDRRVLELCLADMNDKLRDAGFRNAARMMCERLRDDFVRKYRRDP